MLVNNTSNEQFLAKLIAGGDAVAFRKVFDLYKERVFFFILGMVKTNAAAEEIVQEVFIKLWVAREGLAEVENLGIYISVIARNKTIDHLRRAASQKNMVDEIWQAINTAQNTTAEMVEANEFRRLVDEALHRLSQQKQKIFRLSRYEGFSHEEIAQQLHLSRSTVKNHLVETLKYLKCHLADHSRISAIVIVAICFGHQ
jgi:RNA polymerase sigma-70 factor (ECF subfamily)